MIDLGLLNLVKKAIEKKPRNHVTPARLLAVLMQESSGMPYFVDTKPGSLLQNNINMAVNHMEQYKSADGKVVSIRPIPTGLTKPMIMDIITIKDKIGDYEVPRTMVGKIAKFRFEYGYFRLYKHLPLRERFIYSCSWGMCQFMGPNISKVPDKKGIEFILRFAADVEMQLLYAAGMVDELLTRSNGDMEAAYRAYNSGRSALVWKDKNGVIRHQRADVIARGKAVAKSAETIAKYLKMEK